MFQFSGKYARVPGAGMYVGKRDGTGGTGTAKLFFLPRFFFHIKNYYQVDCIDHVFFWNFVVFFLIFCFQGIGYR